MSDDKQLEEVRAYWDDQASTFDDQPDHGLYDPETRTAWMQLFQNWLPTTPLSVLDIGCGTGSISLILAQLGHQVTGIDLSPAMIARARSKAVVAGQAVDFMVMDASFPQFAAHRFDAIVCRHLLWALAKPQAVLEHWKTLLKPEGLFVLVEGFWHTGAGLKARAIIDALPSSMSLMRIQNLSTQSVLWGQEVNDDRYAIIARANR